MLGSHYCGREKPNGEPCRRRAGWGTDHAGEGACRHHEDLPAPVIPPMPPPPEPLRNEGAELWEKLGPALQRQGRLTELDHTMFLMLCAAWHRLLQAERILQEEGLTAAGVGDTKKKHPVFQVWRDTATMVRQLAGEFLLLPSTRGRFPVELPEDVSEFREFLYGRVDPPRPRD